MITKLALRNFRNYQHLDLNIEHHSNVFVGENGQGKTNILEAIFFISMLRSFRTPRLKDLKMIGTKEFYLGAKLHKSGQTPEHQLEVEYGETRRLKLNSGIVRKASDFIQELQVVPFLPNDIQIVQGNSGGRRTFLDMFIAKSDIIYLNHLKEYTNCLKNRNAILRSDRQQKAQLINAFNPILASAGSAIIQMRKHYLALLKNEINTLLSQFDGERHIELEYKFSSNTDSFDGYLEKLHNTQDRDIQRGYTSFGPQIDDFDILLNKESLRIYGSTGQCRLLALCLKMGVLNLLLGDKKNNVIVLVDDVTGELDMSVKNRFFDVISNAHQQFFTFTERNYSERFKSMAHYTIKNGKVVK